MQTNIKKLSTDVLIVGAGPAGLSCAIELSKASKKFIIIEKDSKVGGLSKTYTFKEGDLEFFTDNGPHRFFSKNPYLYEFIEELINEQWITVSRQTRQYIDGKFYDYPINFSQALRNVGMKNALMMGVDYFIAKIKYSIFRKKINTFTDYVYSNFGKTLGEFNMINYTEKIWGIPSATIHPDWATQRIKGLNLIKLVMVEVKKRLGLSLKNKPKSLVDTFYYPEKGTGLIYETIHEKLKSKGYTIYLNAAPKVFKTKNKSFNEAIIATEEGDISIEYKTLVESVPLPSFIDMIDPAIPSDIKAAAKKLTHRSQVYLFITLDKDSITKDQWIYFPSKKVPFARVSEMKNFSAQMSPPGKTSLFVEFFCFEGDSIWNMNDQELFDYALPFFEEMSFFNRSEVRKYYVIKKKDVYPIYNIEYKEYLTLIKKYLDSFKNLYYIGRPGRFRYNNQDHSLEMGILAAKSIIDGVRYDIESVGEEKDYQEKGDIYIKDSKKS